MATVCRGTGYLILYVCYLSPLLQKTDIIDTTVCFQEFHKVIGGLFS